MGPLTDQHHLLLLPHTQPVSHERYDSTYDRDGWHNLSPFNHLIDGQWCWLVAHISESHFVKLLIIMQCQARVPCLRSPRLLLRGHSAPNFSTYTQEHVIRPINLCNSNQNDLWPTLCLCPSLPSPSAAEFPLNPSLSTVCPCRNRLSWRKGVHCVTCSCVPWAIKVSASKERSLPNACSKGEEEEAALVWPK